MIWNIIEYVATFIECFIGADFAVHFLKGRSRKCTLLCFFLILMSDVFITTLLNSFILFEGALGFIRIIVNFIIIFLLMQDTLFEKIMTSVLIDASMLIISLLSLNTLSAIFSISINELASENGFVRLINLFATKFIFFIFTRIMIQLKRRDTYSLSFLEWIALSVVFIIAVFVEMLIFNVTLKYDISTNNLSFVAVGIGLALINVFVYVLMVNISRKNVERTELIIDKMQLEMYRNQLAEAEKQYNNMRNIRHDMKNHLQCMLELLKKNETEKTKEYLNDMLENKLNSVRQYINTGNRVVDIIANTKLSLCQNENIKTVVDASKFELNIDDVDICIVFGNLFDNAIEASRKLDSDKLIIFEVSQKKSYVNIIIKNLIENSILQNNPELSTSKTGMHGIGLKSVKQVVGYYGGMMEFYEQDNFFIVDVWLPSKKIT
ncbi:MAG: GHKL domain-containing protein [Ruminococcus flavefaciens]|nr:GHKL domain-containing protein [Ruminococcus flavefaciens]